MQSCKSKKILFVGRNAYSQHGGIQRFNRRVVEVLYQQEEAYLALFTHDEEGASQWSVGFNAKAWKFAFRFLKEAACAHILILAHINFLPLALIFKIFSSRRKVILFAHGIEVWNVHPYRRRKWFEPFLLRNTIEKIAVVSYYTKNLMKYANSLADEKFEYFPNAVDSTVNNSSKCSKRSNIIIVSRLDSSERKKNVDKVILAFPKILEIVPEASLTIVGDGNLRTELEQLAKECDGSARIHFTGSVSDECLDDLYRMATVFALPSSKEGFGIVYLEAWARGLPVVASDIGAGCEVVSDGVDGFTVNPDDISQIATRITTLLQNSKLASQFVVAGQIKIKTVFSPESFSTRLKKLLEINSHNDGIT